MTDDIEEVINLDLDSEAEEEVEEDEEESEKETEKEKTEEVEEEETESPTILDMAEDPTKEIGDPQGPEAKVTNRNVVSNECIQAKQHVSFW